MQQVTGLVPCSLGVHMVTYLTQEVTKGPILIYAKYSSWHTLTSLSGGILTLKLENVYIQILETSKQDSMS